MNGDPSKSKDKGARCFYDLFDTALEFLEDKNALHSDELKEIIMTLLLRMIYKCNECKVARE